MQPYNGELTERPMVHVWKTCVRVKAYQGFESLTLRKNLPVAQLDRASDF